MSGQSDDDFSACNYEKSTKKIKKEKRQCKRKTNTKSVLEPQQNNPNCLWNKQDEFQVQRIIREEVWQSKRYYLIKWKGYDIALSTWEEAGKFSHMYDLISQFNRSQKGKRDRSIQETDNIMMNPYRATEIHGHFLYADQPEGVQNTIVEYDKNGKKHVYLEIKWKNRETQQGQLKLANSILSSDIIFEHNPEFLLSFYKKSMELRPQN